MPVELAHAPTTVAEAEHWMRAAVDFFGPGFHPEQRLSASPTGVLSPGPAGGEDDRVEAARVEACRLLGARRLDVAFREAFDLYGPPGESAQPIATAPPPCWWEHRPFRPGAPTSVVYRDELCRLWEWEPATRRLHDAAWLFNDYYHGTSPGEFTVLRSADEVRDALARLSDGIGRSAKLVQIRQREEPELSLDPLDLLARGCGLA